MELGFGIGEVIIAALLGTTAASVSAGTAGTILGIAAATWATAINVVLSVAVSIGLSMAISAFTQKSGKQGQLTSGGIMMNTSLITDPIKIIYGEARVGASQVFVHTTAEPTNHWLHVIAIWGEGPVEGIKSDGAGEMIWINDKRIQDYLNSLCPNLYAYHTHNGTMTQGVDADLAAAFPQFADAMRGVCYTYFKLGYGDTWQSFPQFTAVIRGRHLFDPRDGSIGYSNNPALAWLDFMTHPIYAGGTPGCLIDKQSIIDSANTCDSLGFQFNGAIADRQAFLDNLTDIEMCFRAQTIWSGGVYKLQVLTYSTPVISIDEKDIISDDEKINALGIQTTGIQQKPKRVKVTFADKDTDFKATYCYWPQATPYEAAQDGEWDEIELIGVNDFELALKIAKYRYLRQSFFRSFNFSAPPRLMDCEVGEIIQASHNPIFQGKSIPEDWSNKALRIVSFGITQDNKLLPVVQEEDASIYDTTVDVTSHTSYLTTLPNATQAPDPPSNLSAVTGEDLTTKARDDAYIEFSWDNVGIGAHYTLAYKKTNQEVFTHVNIPDPGGLLSDPLFTGAGSLDLTPYGNFVQSPEAQFVIEIDGVASPNTFKWSYDGGDTWAQTGVAITAAKQSLIVPGGLGGPWSGDSGVDVQFDATTGGQMGDYWTFTAKPRSPVVHRINGLPTGTIYNWRVRSYKGSVVIAASEWISPADPIETWSGSEGPSMADVTLQGAAEGTVIYLNWTKDYVEENLWQWLIYRNTTNDPDTAALLDTKSAQTRSYRDTQVAAGQDYYYWLKAVDRDGNVSAAFSGVCKVTYKHSESTYRFETTDVSNFPNEDGSIGYIITPIELENCEDTTGWTTDCAVSGAVTFTRETAKVMQGAASLRVDLTDYPAVRNYEAGTGGQNFAQSSANQYIGQSFKLATGKTVAALEFKIQRNGGTTNNIVVAIYSDSGGKPGTLLVSGTIVASSVPVRIYSWVRCILDSPVALSAGTKYWIVLNSTPTTNYYGLQGHFSGSNVFGDSDEYYGYGSDLATHWTAKTAWDMNFRVEVYASLANKYIYKTISAKDIGVKSFLKDYMYSSRSGSFLSQSFGEAAIGEQLNAVTVVAAGEWELQSWDISGISSASRDAVTKVGFKITDMSVSDFTIYIDQIFANLDWPYLAIRRGPNIEKIFTEGVVPSPYDEYPNDIGARAFLASDDLMASADTEKTHTGDTTYTKVKEIKIQKPGSLRIKFDLKCSSGLGSAYGRVYKNGSALGTEQNQGLGYATFSEDLGPFAAEDLIQLYIKPSAAGYTAYARNFRLYGHKIVLPYASDYVVNTD